MLTNTVRHFISLARYKEAEHKFKRFLWFVAVYGTKLSIAKISTIQRAVVRIRWLTTFLSCGKIHQISNHGIYNSQIGGWRLQNISSSTLSIIYTVCNVKWYMKYFICHDIWNISYVIAYLTACNRWHAQYNTIQ